MAKKNERRSDCPISCSLDIWGDKWSLLIIRDMMFWDKNTYGDILKSGEGIATNILATRLLQLEEAGIILKMAHPDSKVKIFYKLTEKGIDLLPMMVEIYSWAEKYMELPKDVAALIRKNTTEKTKFIRTTSSRLKKLVPSSKL